MPNYLDDFICERTIEEYICQELWEEAERYFCEQMEIEAECYDD